MKEEKVIWNGYAGDENDKEFIIKLMISVKAKNKGAVEDFIINLINQLKDTKGNYYSGAYGYNIIELNN